MLFRNIEQGQGGTLNITPDQPSHVGTNYLMTCVAVYFRVDERRCFFAHIDATTAEIEQHGVVTRKGGEWIAAQVRHRLRQFLQKDNWDTSDPWFGKHLHIQAPCARDNTYQSLGKEYEGKSYETPAKYVVQAIRGFFLACSQVLHGKVKANKHGPKGPVLNEKSGFLKEQAKTVVAPSHHIVIVDTPTGVALPLGRVRDPNARTENKDLGSYEPTNEKLEPEMWELCLERDDRTAFPAKVVEKEDEKEVEEHRLKSRERQRKFRDVGGEAKGRVQMRLKELLG